MTRSRHCKTRHRVRRRGRGRSRSRRSHTRRYGGTQTEYGTDEHTVVIGFLGNGEKIASNVKVFHQSPWEYLREMQNVDQLLSFMIPDDAPNTKYQRRVIKINGSRNDKIEQGNT